jgi:hypothetical protein
LTASITKYGVHFDLPQLSISFDRARRCLVVEGQGDSSEASTGTSYPFSLIQAIRVGVVSEQVSKLVVVFQRGDTLVLCRVERDLATRLAWVLGDLTRAAVDLETTDGAPQGPSAALDTIDDPTGPIGMSVVTRLLDRRGPATQETLRSELFDDDEGAIPEVDPRDVVELLSVRSPPPRAGTPRSRQVQTPARPRRSSVRDTAPDTRSPLWRSDSESQGPR